MERVRLNAALITLESEMRYHRVTGHETEEFINGYLPDFTTAPSQLPIKLEGSQGVFRDVTAQEQKAIKLTLLLSCLRSNMQH